MGGCAGKPRDLDLDEAPAPVEAPATLAAPNSTEAEAEAEAETVPQLQEKKDDQSKEEPLLDLSEPASEAAKNEEVTPATETKPVLDELVLVESRPDEAEKPAEAVDVVKEEKTEVADTVAAPEKTEA